MTAYTILLPPSEGKAPGGDESISWADVAEDARYNTFCVLNNARSQVRDALQQTVADQSRAELEKIFGVKDLNLDEVLSANHSVLTSPLLPAIQRYTGVLFDYLGYVGMESGAQSAFNANTILFSGLWGVLRPTDLIPEYKLKIDAGLPRLGKVSTFWKPHISRILNPLLADQVVWDLLPGAHSQAWDRKAPVAARWQVKFVERVEKRGRISYRTVSHWSKALKGALVRFICAHGITEPSALEHFEHPQGYVYSPQQSEFGQHGGELIFVKRET
jgi:uncharacterized protein